MSVKVACWIGMGGGILIILASIVCFILGVWVGDDRWHHTGGILLSIGFLTFVGSGIASI